MQQITNTGAGLMKRLVIVLGAVAGLSACAPAVRYHPKLIVPAVSAARLESRSLRDPGLRKFIQANLHQNLSAWPAKTWNLKMLTLAALYYIPALQQARAEVEGANAATETAAEKPNPTFRLQPGIPNPYLFALSFLFRIQTAGKRKIMVKQAKDLTLAARLNLAQTTWQVMSNVRAALVNCFLATHEVKLLQLQQRLQTRRVSLLRQRFAEGEISRPPVDHARLSLLKMHVASEKAEGRIAETRAALAAAVGVSVNALDGVRLVWPDFTRPLNSQSISAQQIQREAVLNRLDVRKALAEYSAAQAALQLQIARQYPNFQIGPGYDFEEGHNYFTLGYSVTLPVFNRNQGPVAQAEAQRKAAAAAFLAAQANAIAKSEEALARYRSAWRQLNSAETALMQLDRVVIPKERRTIAAGEAGRLKLNAVLLEKPSLALTWLTALGQTQIALGALEDAVQRPLEPDETALPGPLASHESEKRLP